jgi:hypothetical protein
MFLKGSGSERAGSESVFSGKGRNHFFTVFFPRGEARNLSFWDGLRFFTLEFDG